MTPLCSGAVLGVESTHSAAGDGGATYDIAFAGAGLAALSLAVRMVALPNPPRIILIDPRTEFPHDRTWCHWKLHNSPFDPAITNRWHHWLVRTPTVGTVAAATVRTPYVRIPSDRFYDVALAKLTTSPNITFLRGVSVQTIENHHGHTKLHLSDGKSITATWTFDNRPPQNDNAPWRQIFRGLELHSPEAKLDTSAVTLMDFQSAGPEGIRFFYVLPLDANTALVEDTWLVPSHKNPAFSDEAIVSYASNNLAQTHWRIRHREDGNLPMGLNPSVSSVSSAVKINHRIIPWGTTAGAVRASSGYAFSRIQAASERMAASWQRTGRPDPAAVHGSPLLDWMDRVFLRVMDRHPERVPEFFVRMFDRVPPDALVCFLESEPHPADIFQVMRALPPGPFLRAALVAAPLRGASHPV
jgi:lycopene beta-cyclase